MGERGILGAARCSLLELIFCSFLILSQWGSVAGEEKKNGTHSERYPLVVFDFERVELPYVICLWVLIASLAKIGEYVLLGQHDINIIFMSLSLY